jgi:hypothetical protein
VNRRLAVVPLTVLACLAAWQGVAALQNEAQEPAPAQPESAAPVDAAPAAAKPKAKAASAPVAAARPLSKDETPMLERVAVIGVLNKRNGIGRDVTLRPGQATRLGDLVIRLRACETTADWEPEKLTGAFVQVSVRSRTGIWGRVFSGWLYKETPSLNVVEHPVYDVWPKSCAMTHPDIGPDTLVASAGGETRRSSAAKSTASVATPVTNAGAAPAETPPAANAESSNAR